MIKVIKAIIYFIFCKLLYRVEYVDKQNEESIDKCVLCANHSIWVDPGYIYPVTKNIKIMAKAELFKFKPLGSLLKYLGAYPINRGKKDSTSILHSVNLLTDKEHIKLLIFPEGTRVKKSEETRVKNGATYIAIKAKVPVIPIYISQSPKIFSKVYVKYGKPIYLDYDKHDDKEYINVVSKEVMNKIYDMK